jgi:ferredoxin
MPWVDNERCTGCNVCIEKCPVGMISIENDKAMIDMSGCIRCGTCHNVCPQEAVRHDGEKIPQEVKANLDMSKKSMHACAEHLGDIKEKYKCLERLKKYFNKEKTVAEKTLEELEKIN